VPFVSFFITSFMRLTAGIARVWEHYTPRRFPIAYKLALVFTILITIGMGALGILVVRDQTLFLRLQMSEFGHTIARQMAESAKEQLLAGDSLGVEATLHNLVGKESILGAAIYSEEGVPVANVGYIPPNLLIVELARGDSAVEWEGPENVQGDPLALASFATPVIFQDVTVGYTLITLNSTYMDGAEAHTIRAVGGATFLLVILGAGASVYLGKRLTRPINELMDASIAISGGNYQVRFDDRRNDELGLLMQSMNTMSEGLLRKEQVEQIFSRYVSPKVAKEVLSHIETVELGGQRVEASVLFADIAGFTSMSENMHPEEVSALLNEYFSFIDQAARAFNGHVDKYIGDCAMLVFGVPAEDEDHIFHSIACGIVIQRTIQSLNRHREASGLKPVHFRIGINSGAMLAGNMGSHERMEYTVVGDAVNLASRLASVGDPGFIVITEEMHDDSRLSGRIKSNMLGTIRLRGKRLPVATYRITDVSEEYRVLIDEKVRAILSKTEKVA
jgi:adenylate cyclase